MNIYDWQSICVNVNVISGIIDTARMLFAETYGLSLLVYDLLLLNFTLLDYYFS